jgi:hypothetical protein
MSNHAPITFDQLLRHYRYGVSNQAATITIPFTNVVV